MPARTPPRTPNRRATEAALQRAALDLLERNGVLTGLNLREVADDAGVNRGLVYHYFGSRRDLLRAALRTDVEQRLADFTPAFGLPAAARYESFFRTGLAHRRAIVLALLLVLDGDRGVRMVPDPDGVLDRVARDVDEGELPPDVDGVGLHAALAALSYGYMGLRDHLAAELGTDPDRLDEQVAGMVARLVGGLAAPEAVPAGTGGGTALRPTDPTTPADGAGTGAGAGAGAGAGRRA